MKPVLEELINDVIILTTRCIFTVHSIATQVINNSQFLCVFQQGGREGAGLLHFTAAALQGPVPLSPHSLGRRGEDFYQSGFTVEVKLNVLSNILHQSRSAIAERGALNRCQHFLHIRDRVILRRDIKRFRRVSILECTQVAAGQGCEQPDALSQLVMLSVGGDPVSVLGRGLSSAPLPPSTYYKADDKLRKLIILVPTGFLPGQSKQTCHG